ncbi:hypothetical protein [Cryptosporangium aurantiacum]|uniref:hypothetical protein n=1 Tax=Cryptosporangium aurantiacum TaxID=134849 RepID=UPI0009326281|nr:hypothetical protein [Cryptosporangium aurantiacum]
MFALALTGCSPIDGKMVTYDSVANHVRTAASALQTAEGVRVNGTLETPAKEKIEIDVRINGAGDGSGKIRRHGTVGDVLVIDSATYVRAAAAWWGTDNRAETYDKVWVAIADTTIGLDLAGTLRPRELGALIDDGFGSLQFEGMPPTSEVNGVKARRVEAAGGSLWITVAKPYQVVRLEGGLLTEDSRPAALTVTITPPAATAQIARDVALTLPTLRTGTYDAYRSLRFDGSLRSACNAQGCTITGRIRNASTDTPVTAVLNAKVIGNKNVLGRCRSGRAAVAAAAATAVSCRITTAAWRSFYAAATAPGSGTSTTSYQVSANASVVGPAPDAVACLPGATGCDTPTMTDAEVVATFDRSAPAWYERAPTDRDLPEWRKLIRTAASGKDRVPWSAEGTPTVAYLGTSKGRPFVAQFDRGNGQLVAAYGPSKDEADALRAAIAAR